MKVALINPDHGMYGGCYPIGLAMIASYLRKHNHDVKIIDRASGGNLVEVEGFNPDVVGITGTTPTISDAYYCAKYCRTKGYKVVMGGPHVTALPSEALDYCDTVVVGEGEKAFLNIIENDLKGIIKGEPLMDLDEIPIPAYDLLNMEFYFAKKGEKLLVYANERRLGSMLTSRGCSHNCTFCHNSFRDLKYRSNSPERIIEEMEYLKKYFDAEAIFFVEDNFFMDKERVKKICNLILEKKIEMFWGANARVDSLDKETMILARKAGCTQITFGWESGSQRILNIYKKGITVEQNEESIRLCNEVGILPNGTMMIGAPGETIEDIRKSRDFVINNDILGGAAFCITTPFPGTKMWEDAELQGKIDPEKIRWNDFDFTKVPVLLTEFSEEKLIEMCSKLRQITGCQRESNRYRLKMVRIIL